MGPHRRAAVGERGVALPGAPPQPVVLAARDRHGLDVQARDQVGVGREAAEAHQLLAHDRRLEVALRGYGDVLEVAAAAQARPGDGARRLHAVRRRREDLDRVAAPEPVAVGALGDLDDDPLAGQRVAYEHHPRLRLGQPGDAVAAVGDRAHLDLEALADAGAPARAAGTVRPAHGVLTRPRPVRTGRAR